MNDPPPRRRSVIALILSGIFPGLGQFYNRQPVKGVIGLAVRSHSIHRERSAVRPPNRLVVVHHRRVAHGRTLSLAVEPVGLKEHRVGAHAEGRDAAGGVGGTGFRTGAVILCRRWGWRRGATVDLPYVLQDDL